MNEEEIERLMIKEFVEGPRKFYDESGAATIGEEGLEANIEDSTQIDEPEASSQSPLSRGRKVTTAQLQESKRLTLAT